MVQATRFVIYERDEHGAPYAVEIVEAERWHRSFLEPPSPEQADVRVVWLRHEDAYVPRELPGWLAVEFRERRAAEEAASYSAAADVARTAGGALWPWSPHRREPGASLAEFLSAQPCSEHQPLDSQQPRNAPKLPVLVAVAVAVLAGEPPDHPASRFPHRRPPAMFGLRQCASCSSYVGCCR